METGSNTARVSKCKRSVGGSLVSLSKIFNVERPQTDYWWLFLLYCVCYILQRQQKAARGSWEMNKLLHNSAPMQLLKDVSMFAFKPQCSLWPKVCRQFHELMLWSYNILKLRCIVFIKMTRCRSRTLPSWPADLTWPTESYATPAAKTGRSTLLQLSPQSSEMI